MNKTLEIGKDYGSIFGLTPEMGTMVYNGGDSWTGSNPAAGKTMTLIAPKQTERALEYINRPNVSMGRMA